MGGAQLVGGDLREAQVADLARLHEAGHRADDILDRHPDLSAVEVVEVDHVGAETGQAGVAGLGDVGGVVARRAWCRSRRPR